MRVPGVLLVLVLVFTLALLQPPTAQAAVPASIPVSAPTAIVVDEATGVVAVLSPSTNSVAIIDRVTSMVLHTVPLPATPRALTVGLDGTVYIAAANGTVYVVDATVGSVAGSIETGEGDLGSITADTNGGRVYALGRSARIAVIDATTDTLVAPLDTTSTGGILAVDPATGLIWRAQTNTVSVIDPLSGAVSASITTGVPGGSLVFDPAAGVVYLDASYNGLLVAIDTSTFARRATIQLGIRGIAGALTRDPETSRLFWVAEAVPGDPEDDVILVIDPTLGTLVDRIALPSGSARGNGTGFDAAAGVLYVSNPTDSEVLTFTIASLAGVAPDGSTEAPYDFTYTTGGNPQAVVALASGELPPGLALSATGQLSGNPTTPGTYRFEILATNALGREATLEASITITAGSTATPDPSPTTSPSPVLPTVGPTLAPGGDQPPADGRPDSSLTATGANVILPAAVALGLVLVGAAVVFVRRRRT